MTRPRLRIAVLGDGGWGTTLAIHLHRLGHQVRWWGAFPDDVRLVERKRENLKFLPGIRLPAGLHLSADLKQTVASAGLIILAIPSQHLRSVIRRLAPLPLQGKRVLNVAKGIETATLRRMSEVVREELGHVPLAVLSGPNIASEIASQHPASSVVASHDRALASEIQHAFMNELFRLYTSSDVTGVELGGALKNPIAIAAGISDGLGFGANAKAALITRGVVEMARLGVAMGAREQTFWGLSGLGDLVTTCLGGRNRWLGEQIGKGKSPSAVLAGTPMVIEGVETTRAAVTLGRRAHVELPIIEQVFRILFRRTNPRTALRALMVRARKAENPEPICPIQIALVADVCR